MKKDNTNEYTQIELFDESMNIFEVIEEAEKDIVCEKCIGGTMTNCLITCKNYSCFNGGVL